MGRLDGKVAIVTGGARGIGRAAAEAMAAQGARVVVADLSGELARAVAADIAAAGGTALGHAVDVTRRQQVEALVTAAEEAYGTPSVLCASAGIVGEPDFLDLSDGDWARMLDVNLTGTFLAVQACARRMVAAGVGGSIVTVSSIGAERPALGATAYHASKGAIVGLTRALAVNLARHQIRVNAIAPGYIETRMMGDLAGDPEGMRTLLDRIPLGRVGAAEDLGGVVAFLAGEEAGYLTGQVLTVDGGAAVLGWTGAPAPAG
jgi:NAD(P)-dependent dehydrogenase (short-subunit alcohol dehydrogenase family)